MATNTYVALDKQTLGSNASSITFNSIPQTYTDLVIVATVQGTTGGNGTCVQFNGDTSSGLYSYTLIDGSGSSATSARQTGANNIQSGLIDNVNWGTQVFQVMSYANTTTYKTILGRGNDTLQLRATVGLWRNSNAITSITVLAGPNAYNFITGSTFTLYGIKADTNNYTSKATGGNIIAADQSYVYHAFTAGGTFTPTTAVTADILVIAGGGGGGNSAGASGGGGAGGVLAFASQSLASGTGYTVTVGSGGPKNATSDTQGSSGQNSQFAALTASLGGGGGGAYAAALTGGSGGGGGYFNGSNNGPGYPGAAGTSGQGNSGGAGYANSGGHAGGAGGGAGGTGGTAGNGGPGGTGGIGVNTYTNWGSFATMLPALSLGSGGYLAAGGGGGANGSAGAAGTGGGGAGGSAAGPTNAGNGVTNTGSGGGGGTQNSASAGNGGSGLVIVRYAR
jgi:hypothetical protein